MLEKPAEHVASDGVGSNFSGAPFCMAQPSGGFLVELFSWLQKRFRPSAQLAHPTWIGRQLSLKIAHSRLLIADQITAQFYVERQKP